MSPRYDGGSAGGITALDAVEFKGVWNADTNTPALASGVGQKGDYFTVSVDGSTDLDGETDWHIADAVIFNGTAWERVGNDATALPFARLSSSVDQVPANTNPTAVTYNTQDAIQGITHSVSVNPAEVTIVKPGVYSFMAQPQVGKNSGAVKVDFNMFLQVDRGAGFVDEPNSNVKLTIKDFDITDVIVLGFPIALNAGDKIRVMQKVEAVGSGIGLKATAAVVGPPTVPATPSVILAITRGGHV